MMVPFPLIQLFLTNNLNSTKHLRRVSRSRHA